MEKTTRFKDIPLKKILLIILFITMLLSLFYIAYILKQNFKPINHQANQKNEVISINNNSSIPQTDFDTQELYKQIEYLNKEINEIKAENYQLEKKLKTSSTAIYRDENATTYNILLNKLLNTLQSNQPFEDTLSTLISMNQKNLISQDLKELNQYSKGVSTLENLTSQFQNTIYKNIYLSELRKNPSIMSQIKFMFYSLVFIKNTQPSTTNQLSYNLYLIELNLLENQPEIALKILNSNNFTLDNQILMWINDLQKRIKINLITEKLKKDIGK